jgi:hypothetical protein
MRFSRNYLTSLRFWWRTSICLDFQTSRHCVRHEIKPVSTSVWNSLKCAGILKRTRGTRGGKSKLQPRTIQSVISSNFTNNSTLISKSRIAGPERRNLLNLVNIHVSPTLVSITPSPTGLLNLCHLNARSINNKSMVIKDFVVDNSVDIMALTETWLRPGNESDYIIRDICPNAYLYTH